MTSSPAAAESGYRPTVSRDYAQQIKHWHEQTYQRARIRGESTYQYLGLTLEVPADVMPITPLSELLGTVVLNEVESNDRVLDMGTGSGVNAILAATKSQHVLAVDINPHAVEAARRNAIRNRVADRVDVRHSDVYSAVEGKFDLVIFDPPSRWFAPRDLLEMASTDVDYCALTTFVRGLNKFLNVDGRALIFFGTSGDLGYLHQLLLEERYVFEVLSKREVQKGDQYVTYFTHRITRSY